MQEEQPSREQLTREVEDLREQLNRLTNENADLQILLENSNEHHDMIEDDLHNQTIEALRQSEERFRLIAEATPLPVIISRLSDGAILYANTSSHPFFGVTSEQMLQSQIHSFYCDQADGKTILDMLAKDGYVQNCEIRYRRTDETTFWVAASLRKLLFNAEPSLLSALCDITERKRAEEELQYTKDQLQAILDAMCSDA